MRVLFFRNTHSAPDFTELRPDLQGRDFPWVVHLLNHTSGTGLEEIVRLHEGFAPIQNVLRDLANAIDHTFVRAEVWGFAEIIGRPT